MKKFTPETARDAMKQVRTHPDGTYMAWENGVKAVAFLSTLSSLGIYVVTGLQPSRGVNICNIVRTYLDSTTRNKYTLYGEFVKHGMEVGLITERGFVDNWYLTIVKHSKAKIPANSKVCHELQAMYDQLKEKYASK